MNKFQPHILRSASMAARIAAGEDVDNVLRLASVSRKVFSTYYELPMGGETSGSVASSIGAQAARLALQHSNGSQVPALANASGAVLANMQVEQDSKRHKPTPAIMADGASPSSQLTQRWPPGSPEG